jgi:hypothetical protein
MESAGITLDPPKVIEPKKQIKIRSIEYFMRNHLKMI